MMAILAGYAAVIAFGITSLVALGFLLAGRGRVARIVFASGLLGAATVMALGLLTFLSPRYYHQADLALIVVPTVSLYLAGGGQFVAALRGAGIYAAAFACTVLSLGLLASPLLGADWGTQVIGDLGRKLAELGIPVLVAASLVPAAASMAIAVFWPLPPAGPARNDPKPGVRV